MGRVCFRHLCLDWLVLGIESVGQASSITDVCNSCIRKESWRRGGLSDKVSSISVGDEMYYSRELVEVECKVVLP